LCFSRRLAGIIFDLAFSGVVAGNCEFFIISEKRVSVRGLEKECMGWFLGSLTIVCGYRVFFGFACWFGGLIGVFNFLWSEVLLVRVVVFGIFLILRFVHLS